MLIGLREGTITPEKTYVENLGPFSTITGWSSFTSRLIRAYDIGNLSVVQFLLSGTSNTTTAVFTLPGWWMQKHSPVDPGVNWYPIRQTFSYVNNGTRSASPGYFIYADTSGTPYGTVTLLRDLAATAFTASGTKTVAGYIVFSKNI